VVINGWRQSRIIQRCAKSLSAAAVSEYLQPSICSSYRYFRLSFAVAIPYRHFLCALHVRKFRNLSLEFKCICHSFGDVFPVSKAISGCRSLLQSPAVTRRSSFSWSKTHGSLLMKCWWCVPYFGNRPMNTSGLGGHPHSHFRLSVSSKSLFLCSTLWILPGL